MLNVVQTILFTSALASYHNENWCDSDSECPRGQFCVPSETGTCKPGIFNPMTGEDFRCAHECSTKAHYPKSKSGSEIIYRPVVGRMDAEAEPMMGAMEDAGTVVFTPEAGAYCRYDSHCASFERCTTSNFCIRKSGALHGERCERPKHYQCAAGHACSRAGYCVNQSGSPLGAKCAKDSHCAGSLVCEKFGGLDGTCQRFMGRRLDGDDTLEFNNDAVEDDIARRLGEATEVFTPGEAMPAYPYCRYSYDCASFEYCTTDHFCLRKTGGLHGERCEQSFHCAAGHACSRAGFCVDQNDQGGLGERCAKDSHCAGSLVCEKFGSLDGTCQRFMGRRLDGDATEDDTTEADDVEETDGGDDRRRIGLQYTLCLSDSDCFDSDEYCVTTGPTRPFCLKRSGGLHGDRCTSNSQCKTGHNCSRDQICVNTAGAGDGQVCTRNYHCKGSLQCISHNGKPVDNGKSQDGVCGRESGAMMASMMAPPMGAMDAMDLIPFGAMEDLEATVVASADSGGFCRADSHCASFERCTTSNFCIRKSGALHGERCERPKHYQCAAGHACSRAGYCVNQSGSPLGAKCAKDSHCAGSLVCEKFGMGDGTCQRFMRRADSEAGPAPMM